MNTGRLRSYLATLFIVTLLTISGSAALGTDKSELVRLFSPFPRHLNPAITDDLSVAAAASSIFASLLEVDKRGAVQPWLADWWEISDDGRTYTFYLVEDATFHDGKPITSKDVLFSYETFRRYHPNGDHMFRKVTDAVALEPFVFVMHLTERDTALPLCLAGPFMPILPKHVFGENDILQNPANIKPVGSGPFRVTRFRAGEFFKLERFKAYFRPKRPILNSITGLNGENPWFAVSTMNSGTAHLFTFVKHPDTISLLSDNPLLKIRATGYEQLGALNYLEFNLRKKELKDPKVRQAIAHAIDLEHINATVYNDYALSLDGPLPLNSPFFKAGSTHYDLNLELAEQLLDEAGLARNEEGIRFESHLTWAPDPSGLAKKTAAYIQSQLKKIGIQLILDTPRTVIDWHIQVAKWQHHMSLSRVITWGNPGITLHPLFSSRHLEHRLGSNTSGFYSEQADVLLKAAEKETEPTIQSMLYNQFQSLAAEQLPLYFMHETPWVTIIHKDLQNFPATGRGVVGSLERISWKEPETVENRGKEENSFFNSDGNPN